MSEVFFEILSPLPLNSNAEARQLFNIWAEQAPNFFSDRSGLYEPLRRHFSLSTLGDSIRTWEFQFLLKRVAAPKLQSHILMQYGPHRRHSTWTIGLMKLQEFDGASFEGLLEAAARTFLPDFGLIHVITAADAARGLSNGSITFLDVAKDKRNLFLTTHILEKFLPDIYWTTLFGARYVELFSKDRLLSAPAYRIEELDGGGIVLQLTPELADVTADEAAFERTRDAVRRHLDSDAIYDPSKGMNHRYKVPEFSWAPVLC